MLSEHAIQDETLATTSETERQIIMETLDKESFTVPVSILRECGLIRSFLQSVDLKADPTPRFTVPHVTPAILQQGICSSDVLSPAILPRFF